MHTLPENGGGPGRGGRRGLVPVKDLVTICISFLLSYGKGCLVLVGKDIELDTVGRPFEPRLVAFASESVRRPSSCGVTGPGYAGFPNSLGNKAAANLRLFLWQRFC